MDTTPHVITDDEWREILTLHEVRGMWGIEEDERWEDVAAAIYGVRFDFFSGTPGFVGDLYILQGDHLGVPPLMLTRDRLVRHGTHPEKKPLAMLHLWCEHAPPATQ
jgi:hypothetical protein